MNENQILYHQRGAHQKLNSEIKRRTGGFTLSDANLSDQKIAEIIERENGLIIFFFVNQKRHAS
jgi:hypothetical protein